MNGSMMCMVTTSAALLALGVAAVQAAPLGHVERAFQGKPEVSDAALGEMRGRFISGNQIVYFGVAMSTSWQVAATDAVVGTATLNVGIQRNGGGTPIVNASSSVSVPNPGSGESVSPGNGGGLDQVQGISQLVQVTGNGNGVHNVVGVDVVTGAVTPLPPTDDGNKITKDTQTGVTAQTILNDGATVIVSYPMQGVASQTVAGMTGVQQRAQISGDGYKIQNQLNLVIQVDNSSTMTSTNTTQLMHTLRSLGQSGIH